MYKFVTTDQMRELLFHSEQAKLSRLPSEEFWVAVDPDGKHVLSQVPPFEPGSVRSLAFCKMRRTLEPAVLFLDFREEDWELLPSLPSPATSDTTPKGSLRRQRS
jgi:hypothetical protein